MSDRIPPDRLESLVLSLQELRQDALRLEREFAAELQQVPADVRPSARNLLHYVAFRRHDLRPLQRHLSRLGLSSLGRNEAHALAGLEAVLATLQDLGGKRPAEPLPEPPVDMTEGPRLLAAHAERLLGPVPAGRPVRIMVTMPSEAATDYGLVRDLVAAGMDVMRINCSHDSREAWEAMAAHLRRACGELDRPCRILADLGGPKLRTGALPPGPPVMKIKPRRDSAGTVLEPASVRLAPAGTEPTAGADRAIPVDPQLVAASRAGDLLRFADHRGRRRMWAVTAVDAKGLSAQTNRTAYVEAGSVVRLCRDGSTVAEGRFGGLPPLTAPLVLRSGDMLNLTAVPVAPGDDGEPTIACTLPEVFAQVRPGDRILFDDGKIAGVIREARPDRLRIEITQTPSAGAKLGADKGINLPDSDVRLPGLTAKDLADLDFVAARADMVGLSFVRGAADVGRVQSELSARGAKLGIVLKIETRAAFEHLPRLLLTGLRTPPVGVVVARGDLGVEMGFERLAEVQEEILWLCEAAHVPVVWATQVLEGLAKSGMPSRAEVTDAAMAGRAECVMLNKGPYVVEAVRFLDNVLRRMRDHQEKKRAMLRKLSVSALA